MNEPAGNQRGRDTRRRILGVAAERFEARGLDLTLDEVARAAGTTRMTVHRHTGGREALITHLVLLAITQLADGVRTIVEDDRPFPERLVDAMAWIISEIRSSPHMAGLFTVGDLTGTWPTLDPDERVLEATSSFFRPYLDQAAADGLLRTDPEPTLDWLLRQVLLFLVVPASAPTDHQVRHELRTFVLPAVLRPA
ncbi:MAG: regulatory protein TetR [Acidimicrobiales bacterium]|nr:regulatory protein TetR [Acidimicrobiales bacterium]